MLAERINIEHLTDGFFGMVVQGKQRIGKSSYTQQALAESNGKWEHSYADNVGKEIPVCVKRDSENKTIHKYLWNT